MKAVREEDKDPATKAKEKLQQRIDMYKVNYILFYRALTEL